MMNHTMTEHPTAAGPLVAHWVETTDLRGRAHLEMRWAPAAAPSPAPAGAHQHAA